VYLWATDGYGPSWGVGRNFGRDQISKLRDPAAEEILIDWYIEVSFAVLSRTAASDLVVYPDASSRIGAAVWLARWLEPRVSKSRPMLHHAWRVLMDQLNARLLPQQEAMFSRVSLFAKEHPDWSESWRSQAETPTDRIKRLLEQAGKETDPARRDFLYQEAAIEAERTGDRSRALEIAEKIKALDFREQVRDWINYNAATRALNEGRPEVARQYAVEIAAPDQRASLFCAIARIALKEKDETGAAVLLNEAEGRTIDADVSPAKVRALIMIANQFSRYDPPRAYQVMAKAVEEANKIPDYGSEQAKTVRSLRNAAGQKQGLVHQAENADIEVGMAVIATVDFDGAQHLCQSLENKSLRLSSTIAVASKALKRKSD
jgi:hypothetical protein